MVKISYDREVDALYIRLKETTVTTDRVEEGIALDYDASDRLAGIEILDAGKRLDSLEASKAFASGTIETDQSLSPGPSTPISLSATQRDVLDALKRVETKKHRLGDWYLGALYALENPNNPDRISQAAQSLRELMEKLPRVARTSDALVHLPNFPEMRREIFARLVDDKIRYGGVWKEKAIDAKLEKTISSTYRYMELNQHPTRKEQIQDAIGDFDPMADQMGLDIQKRKRDAFHSLWYHLEGFAHHRSSGPDDEERFRQYLVTLEHLVYDLLAPITAQDQQEIQSIMGKSGHSDTDAETLYRLISRRGANYVYFFMNVTDPAWIKILRKKGFFRNPPPAERPSDDCVRFPFWPELRYLEKVCTDAPGDVLELVLQIPAVDNPNVYANVLDIALKLDGERSGKLKQKMLEYAKLETPFIPFRFPQLLAHWTAEGQTEAALELARILVQFVPDPNAEEKRRKKIKLKEDHTDSARNQMALMMTTLTPTPRFSEIYREILGEGIRPLAKKEPYKVARMLIDATKNKLHDEVHKDEIESSETDDHTRSWCPRLDKSENDDPDLGKSLVHALTYACEMVYERESESVENLDRALRSQRWYLFNRLRQHLLARYPSEQTQPRIREMILGHTEYGTCELHYELQRMIRLAFKHFGAELLTIDERVQIFDTILSGPPKEDFRKGMGEQFSNSVFEHKRRYFHRKQLRPFATVLFGEYADYIHRLKANENAEEITDESYSPVTYSKEDGIVTSRSPRSAEALANLSDEELLNYINDWEDEYWDTDDGLTEINVEALSGAFQSVFSDSIISNEERLNFWIKNRDNILRPIYVRVMIDAMQDLVKAKDFDRLDVWFAFCRWVLSHPDSENEEGVRIGRLGDGSRESPNWHTSRRAVCDFVEACMHDEVDVLLWAREDLAGLLEMLCTQYDWRLDVERQVLLNRDDQLTEAMITTRGRALENLVKFGFWVRRRDEKAEVSELKAVIEKRFGTEAEYPLTLPEYAILGMRFGSLTYLDEQWAVSRKSLLFPHDDLPAWREAFGNFIRWSPPCPPFIDWLHDDFEIALEQLESPEEQKGIRRELTLKLGQHLFTYYKWDVYPLNGDNSLLERFYLKTDDGNRKHWATLFNYVGRSLQDTGQQLDKGVRDRIVAFFEWRLDTREPTELREFAAWMKAECLDAEWRLNALSKVLDVKGILDETGTLEEGRPEHPRTWLLLDVTRSMPALLPMHTPLVVECFAKITNAAPRSGGFYIPTDDAKAILKAGLENRDKSVQKNAEHAQENLFSLGILRHTD